MRRKEHNTRPGGGNHVENSSKITIDIKELLKQMEIDPNKFMSLCLTESELKDNTIQVSALPLQKQ